MFFGVATCVSLAMAQSKRMSDVFGQNTHATPKTTENGAKTEPKRSPERAVRTENEQVERSLAQDARFFLKRSARGGVAAQKERFGGAVGAPDLRSIRPTVKDYT